MGSGLQAGVDGGRNAHLSPGARLQGQHTSISPGAWAAELTLLLLHDVIMANRLLAAWQRQKKLKSGNCIGKLTTIKPGKKIAGAPLCSLRGAMLEQPDPSPHHVGAFPGLLVHGSTSSIPRQPAAPGFSPPAPEAKQLLPRPGARRLLRAPPGGHCLPRGVPKGQLLLRSWAGEDDALSRHFPQPPQLCRIIISLAP